MKYILMIFVVTCLLQGCVPKPAVAGMKKDCNQHTEMCHKHRLRHHHE